MGTGLEFKPLWPEDEDAFALAEGPHLVAMPGGDLRENAVDDLLEILGDHPQAAVWWAWPVDPDLLVAFQAVERHLRSLAMIEVPTDRFDADESDREEYNTALVASQGDSTVPPPSPWEAVFFRHFDANVLASVLSLLNIAQFSRLFGGAGSILMQAPDFGGLNEAPRPDDLPAKPAGLLRLSHEQYDELSEKQLRRSRLLLVEGLRENFEEQTSGKTDKKLYALVVDAEKSGRKLGISSEQAHFFWAVMVLLTNGAMAGTPGLKDAFSQAKGEEDEAMEELYKQFIGELDKL